MRFERGLSLTMLALALGACGPLVAPKSDSGSPGGGGASTGGGSALTGGGTGSTGGGSGNTGGGAMTGGGVAASDAGFTFSVMSMLGTTTSAVGGISGAPGDVWAIQNDGKLLHSTGGAFTKVVEFPSSSPRANVYAAGGTVIVTDETALYTCTVDCANAPVFAKHTIYVTMGGFGTDRPTALCGRGPQTAYALARYEPNDAAILHVWDGAAWTRVGALPLVYPHACTVDAMGAVFIAGRDGVVRYQQGSSAFEAIAPGEWWAVAAVDGVVQAAGDQHRIARRAPNGTWSVVFRQANASTNLYGIVGVDSSTFFAAGSAINSSERAWYRSTAGVWAPAAESLPGFPDGRASVSNAQAVSVNEFYIVGSGPGGGTIVRGKR